MNSYEPGQEKRESNEKHANREGLVASQIYQGIWEAEGESSCTFDIQLKAAKKHRKKVKGFIEPDDLHTAA